MKAVAKTTLNSIEDVLAEINSLVAQKEKEDYGKIFMKRNNLTTTYQSNEYVTIMDVSSTLFSRRSFWEADLSL